MRNLGHVIHPRSFLLEEQGYVSQPAGQASVLGLMTLHETEGKVTLGAGWVVVAQGTVGEKRRVWFMGRGPGPLGPASSGDRGLHGKAQTRLRWQWEAGEGRVVSGMSEVTDEGRPPVAGGEVTQCGVKNLRENVFLSVKLPEREAEIHGQPGGWVS